jgi:hypothetical protein
MDCPVYLVYPDAIGWVVRRMDAGNESAIKLASREAALLRARRLADEHSPSRIVVFAADGVIGLNYDV